MLTFDPRRKAPRQAAPAGTSQLGRLAGRSPEADIADATGHPAFDFGRIRIHSDAQAAASAASLNADAYARGTDIIFGAGRYRPDLPSGRQLLMHEMAHVVQQQNPGPYASKGALEQEADRAAADAARGRAPQVRLAAPPAQAQCQKKSWTTGDVFVDATASNQIQTKGGLFSGNDQAHVNVSSSGKLAYDASHTTPEDPFRWSKLKDIIDSGHVKIFGVSNATKFKVQEVPGQPPVDRSLVEIGLMQGDLSTAGIFLKAGDSSPDPVYDMIYYDKDMGVGALTHELFGHGWLSLKGAPWVHPPAGTKKEKEKGTISRVHQIRDPFGNLFEGTVRDYIAKYIESVATKTTVTTSAGQTIDVPKSPTQKIGTGVVVGAFTQLHAKAAAGLTKSSYSAAVANAWRALCDNYDMMQGNAQAMKAGNSDLTYTKEIILSMSLMLFRSWTPDQQSGFRILLADFTGSRQKGWAPNELSTKLEQIVGAAASPFRSSSP